MVGRFHCAPPQKLSQAHRCYQVGLMMMLTLMLTLMRTLMLVRGQETALVGVMFV